MTMPKQIVKVESPLRGVNRAASREEQPELSIFDSLNMLPFDRTKRLRIGQRAGAGELLHPASGNVLGLYQVTLGQEEITDPTTLFKDEFAYSAGGLDTVDTDDNWETGIWHLESDLSLEASADSYVVNSDHTLSPKDLSNLYYARFAGSLDWTNHQKISMQATIKGKSVSTGGLLYLRHYGPVDSFQEFGGGEVIALLQWNSDGTLSTVEVTGGDGSNDSTVTIFTGDLAGNVRSSDLTFKLEQNGTTFTVSVNGTDVTSITQSGLTLDGSDAFPVVIFNPGQSGEKLTVVEWDDPAGSGDVTSLAREVKLIATGDKNVFVGDLTGMDQVGSSNILTASKPCLADYNGHVYIVDGTHVLDFDVRGNSIGDYTPDEGDSPTGSRWVRSWRGRLIFGGSDDAGQNFFATKVGDPQNIDLTDPGTPGNPFDGNASKAGQVGDILLDGVPFTNDVFLLMGDHTIWAINGDPTDGGSIDMISGSIGILGRDAWTVAPDGTLYFIGTGGLFKIQAGSSTVQPLSLGLYPQFFQGIDRKTSYFGLQYDRDSHGLYIFVTSITNTASTHLWYDVRTESLWPLQFPGTHGPMSSLIFDGDKPNDRVLLLGGRTGKIYFLNTTALDDTDNAISAYVVLGPFHPTDGAAVLSATTIDFGELAPADQENAAAWNVDVTLQAGPDAYSVTDGTPHSTATISCPLDRRQKTMRQRLRGGWFTMKLANATNDSYFAFESATLEFEPAGKLRERR